MSSNPCAGLSGLDLDNCIASSYGSQGIIPPDQVNATSGQQVIANATGLNGLFSASTWIRVGLFAFALVFLIVGFMVLTSGGNT